MTAASGNATHQRIGLQLYSVRELAERDLISVLQRVAAIGYTGVEFAGLHDTPPSEIRDALDSLGLEAIGAHVGLEDLEGGLDATIEDIEALGCRAAIVAWLPPESYGDAAKAHRTVDRLLRAGEAVRAAGLEFAYHNHHFEFAPIEDGPSLWSMLTAVPLEALPLELDIYWVRHAGVDPTALLADLGPRVTLIHAKDTAADGSGDAPVGVGVENWPEILELTRRAGVEWLVIEQERSSDIYADIARSLENLGRLLP